MGRIKGIVNKSNRFVHSGRKGQPVTIIKSFFYNGEGWYLTEEIGEVPNWFITKVGKE
tara:strand:+ start:274 stop:447 length:174 start_codon:yes stop_codon:yes gene_type:complete